MDDDLKKNIKEPKTWSRGLYMLMFLLFYSLAEITIFAVIAFQFVLALFTGKTNEKLLMLGQSLSTYVYQVLRFLTFNSEEHPYPFSDWPAAEPGVVTKQVEEEK